MACSGVGLHGQFDRPDMPGLVVVGLPMGMLSPEHVGRADDVAERGEPFADRLDVRTDPEDLLDEHQTRAVSRVGHPELQIERCRPATVTDSVRVVGIDDSSSGVWMSVSGRSSLTRTS